MNEAYLQTRLDHFRDTCRERGLRLTPQKQEIFRVVASTERHPTAQDIFDEVKERFPRVSFATVYDNLRKFKEMELIREMNCGEGCTRYDANMDQHHHVIDAKTGKVMDVCLPEGKTIPIPKELEGKFIREIKITYIV